MSQPATHMIFKTLQDVNERISVVMAQLQNTIINIVNAGIIAAGPTYVAFVDAVVGSRAWTDLWLSNSRIVFTNQA